MILRDLIALEDAGGDVFFGEPEFETADLLRTAADGRGIITSVELPGVVDKPQLFSTFLMWLLADLFHELPEVGDPDKPKLVFFFDEAHLLFNGASKAFLQAVTQTVRLIRSKGVGHLLRDPEPERRARRRARPARQPGSARAARIHARRRGGAVEGGADVSEDGELRPVRRRCSHSAPARRSSPCSRIRVRRRRSRGPGLRAPRSLMAQIDPAAQAAAVTASPLEAKYGTAIDRDSAYERLQARLAPAAPAPPRPSNRPSRRPRRSPGHARPNTTAVDGRRRPPGPAA